MRQLAILLLCLSGCGTVTSPHATVSQIENGKAYVASLLAFMPPADSPAPTPPNPIPTPGETCRRCNGSGRIRPDGRIEIACPDCDGTGKTTQEINNAWALSVEARIAELARLTAEVERLTKAVSARQPAPTVAAINWLTNLDDARQRAKELNRPVVVHFYLETCQPCKVMDRQVFADRDVAAYINANCVAVRVDADSLPAQSRRQWQVSSVPADFVVTPSWSKSYRVRSSADAASYLNALTGGVTKALTAPVEKSVLRRTSYQPVYREYVQPYFQPQYYSGGYYGGGMYYGGGGGSCGPGGCF